MNGDEVRFGVIGGSGVYGIDALKDIDEVEIDTPFGSPSDAILVGTLHGERVAFLARHGRGHYVSPSRLPYRANIYAMKKLGVEYLIGVSACGSLRERLEPGHIVIPDQLVDRTSDRVRSFFDDAEAGSAGIVAHVGVADPFCADLSKICYTAVEKTGATVHRGGRFITIEGPRFSTRAESELYRQWGMDIIGMTTSPEAFLAREAEMSYAVMAHITDYDVWHESEEDVSVEAVVRTVKQNAEVAKAAIVNAVEQMANLGPSPYRGTLREAIMTDSKRVPRQAILALNPLVGPYFD